MAIKSGEVSVESLRQPKVYFFTELKDKPGFYEHEGKEYSKTEYDNFCKEIELKRTNSIIWNEGKEYDYGDIIITYLRNTLNEEILDKDILTLNIK